MYILIPKATVILIQITNIPANTNHHMKISIHDNTFTNTNGNIYTNTTVCISIDTPTNTITYSLWITTLSPILVLALIIC